MRYIDTCKQPMPLFISTTNIIMISIIIICISSVTGGWIDPATYRALNIDSTQQNITIESYVNPNRKYRLVMSDEFNTNGRQFHDGSDPKWTSINKDDYTNYALHYYNGSLVNTNDGFLNITTIIEDVTFTFKDVKVCLFLNFINPVVQYGIYYQHHLYH